MPGSRTCETLEQLRKKFAELIPASEDEVTPAGRLSDLIPSRERRRVWQAMQQAGFSLPELTLSTPVFVTVAALVCGPMLIKAWLAQSWMPLLSLAELARFAYHLTRPLAIHPPLGCRTVHQAAMHATPFRLADYQAGCWPATDIADRVRWIVASVTGNPFESITSATRLDELC